MIHRTSHGTIATWPLISWQEELSKLIIDPEELIKRLELSSELIEAAKQSSKLFPLRLTESYFAKIKKGDLRDPLLLQVLPLHAEQIGAPNFVQDPLKETDAQPQRGVIHKYKNRVLLIASTQCAINCRYCFRRHFPYQENRMSSEDWDNAISYVQEHKEIDEVILSGGDPLSLSDKSLETLVQRVADIPHVQRLRIHTRFPIILPRRISPSFIQAITSTRLRLVMVIHANHVNELDIATESALDTLNRNGVHLLNQSVLLAGVNDCAESLKALSLRLFECNVLPYYLHLLDKVQGAAHFLVEDERALVIYKTLQSSVSGYLLPKLVRETAGERSKSLIPIMDSMNSP